MLSSIVTTYLEETYVLKIYADSLQGHLENAHFLMLFLKILRLSDCFASSGTNSYIFGPRKDNDSVPWYTECTCLLDKLEFVLKL